MTADLLLKNPVDNVSEIVDKTKILVDRLRYAIIQQDNFTKDCFDTNATELSNTVDSIKKSYLKLTEEYQAVNEEIKGGEKRLNDILEEYKELQEENARLIEVENGLLNSKNSTEEHGKTTKKLREVLQAYKLLTGVRFDFNEPDSNDGTLSGYVAISGNKPSNSTIIPFEFDIENTSKGMLWPVINKACLEIGE